MFIFQEPLSSGQKTCCASPIFVAQHKRQQKTASGLFLGFVLPTRVKLFLLSFLPGSKYYLPARRAVKVGVGLRRGIVCRAVFSSLISSAPVSHSTDIILLSTNKGTFVFFTRPPPRRLLFLP
jgi:hypothetical protein